VVGYKPHAISVAKALSSAYQPIAATLIPEDMYQAMLAESRKIGTFGHGYTYSGHPVAAAVALKTLEIYARDNIFDKAAAKAPQFQAHFAALGDHPLVGEARGVGLIGAVELVADRKTKKSFDAKSGVGARCVAFAQEEGLLTRAVGGDNIALCPPLIITPDEIDDMFARLTRALDRTLDWAKREKLLG
jgi:4-aminobutyrate--pyruvate transaminase